MEITKKSISGGISLQHSHSNMRNHALQQNRYICQNTCLSNWQNLLNEVPNSVLPNLFSTTAHFVGTAHQTSHWISGTYFVWLYGTYNHTKYRYIQVLHMMYNVYA